MLNWALAFFIIALVAAFFGFIVLSAISLAAGLLRGRV